MSDLHVHDRLSAWIDGALPHDEAGRVEQHVKGCTECSAARDALVEHDRALKAALTHDPGDAYFESLAQRIEASVQPSAKPRARKAGWFAPPLLLRWASAAAVLVAGSVVAFFAYQRGGGSAFEKRSALQENARSAPAPTEAPPPVQGLRGADTYRQAMPDQERDESSLAQEEAGKKSLPTDDRQAVRSLERSSRMRELNAPPQPAAPLSGRIAPAKPVAVHGAPPAPILAPKSKNAEPMSAEDRLKERDAAPARNEAATPQSSTLDTPPAQGAEGRRNRPDAGAYYLKLEADSLIQDTKSMADKDARVAEVQVCGRVADPSGRPLAGAQVVATNLGRVATTDATGRYCLTLPPGRHDVRILSVGYVSTARLLNVGAEGAGEVAFTVAPVSALGEGLVLGDQAQGKPALPVDGLQKSPALSPAQKAAQNAWKQARASQERAAGKQTAGAWDAAASEWDKALRSLEGGDLELEARAAAAECRYRAWKAQPTATRSKLATQALTAYLVRAPVGPARDRAAAWAEEVK